MFRMTEEEMEAMYIRKQEYIDQLQKIFQIDPRSGVVSLEYHRKVHGYPEAVQVKFVSGFSRYINVTGNSNGANYRQLGNMIYGGEVIGEFFVQEEANAGTDV